MITMQEQADMPRRPDEASASWGWARFGYSRNLYLDLSQRLPARTRSRHDIGRALLEVCERAVERVAADGGAARVEQVATGAFQGVRSLFAASDQLLVRMLIRTHLDRVAAVTLSGTVSADDLDVCRAATRRGAPCRRARLAQSRYCPSHAGLGEG